jgi:hypothetical protein
MNKIVTYGTMKYTMTAITTVSKTVVVTPKKVVLLSSRRWFLYLASASTIVLYPL